MKKKDVPAAEKLLFELENDYVSACGRFLAREEPRDTVWLLCGKNEVFALVINSKSTIIPVFPGIKEIPDANTLKKRLKKNRIYSVQGQKNEVLLLENMLAQTGMKPCDTYNYDLMNLDREQGTGNKEVPNLVLRVPQLIDLDAIAPLQAGYEKEEVLPRGSVFSPAASRVNLFNIIANGKILIAQIDGRMAGKINVSAVSYTRYLVGGVYICPEFRGLGIGRRMTSAFISSLLSEGRGVTLFVKKNNTAARRLYCGLGFSLRGDYRIAYY